MGDPMSAVGMGFASLTLPAQMFSSGVVAYTTISQIRGMGTLFERYYSHFKIQESRYIFWGTYHQACSPGGLDRNEMPHIIYERIVNTLIQINSLLEDRDTLCARYGMQQSDPMQPVDMNLIRRESLRQQNMVKRLQKSSSLLRKVQWTVRDQARFAEFIQQLKDLIDVLYESLPVPSGSYMNDTIRADAIAEMLISRATVGDVDAGSIERGIVDAGFEDLQQIQRATDSSRSREQDEGAQVLRQSATLLLPPPLDARQLEFPMTIPNAAPHIRAWARPRQNSQFSGQDFFVVEWRRYDPQRGKEALKAMLQVRIQALVKMLKEKPRSDSFRVLDCIGFFEDNTDTRFGITFRLPNSYNLQQDPAPKSLFEIISKNRDDIPYLGDRFRLAYLLAESTHALHTTGWLHKSICSQNILLFPRNMQQSLGISPRPISLETPYFTGFALSRPDDLVESMSLALNDASALEMEIYRHPDYRNRGISKYRAIYDIYSLGIVLVELGTWRTVKKFYPRSPLPANFDFKKHLLDNVVPGLGAAMGERYMNVVKKCLQGDFERLAGFNEHEYESPGYKENVRQGLLWEVVTILRDCRA